MGIVDFSDLDLDACEIGMKGRFLDDRPAANDVVAPGFEEAFYSFRRELIYGYILFISNGDGQQFRSETMNSAVTVRYAMAAEDSHMLSAIEG